MVETGVLNLPKFSFCWNFYVNERSKPKKQSFSYCFFLCRLALLRFFRLWVATLCLFLFLPLGINLFFIRYFLLVKLDFKKSAKGGRTETCLPAG